MQIARYLADTTLTRPTWPARALAAGRGALAAAALALSVPAVAAAQGAPPPLIPLRPAGPWRTIETPHFRFLYPAELEPWTRAAAERAEAQRDAVRRLVGWAPERPVWVLVADPFNDANGSAYPFLDAPGIFLWPVPPGPRSTIGNARSWPELLVVHEFAHVAHLARPTRNPLRRTLGALVPASLGPIPVRTPRWVWEGYATFVEGRLTGSGRPHGAWRAAILRQWAIEGRLPSYARLNALDGFYGGSFAYLAGSAYLEWLVAQRGDSALPHLWRRLTARQTRSFDEAFAGVFPGTPAELYARWTAQVTAEAVAAERELRRAGIAEGALVQRLAGGTGDPAVSPDGKLVALVLRPPKAPSRIVVWRTGAEPRDTLRPRRIARLLRRDPEDVAPVDYLPPPKRALSTLPARDGRSFDGPRFMPDGRHVLVERDETRQDGTVRPDLWLWDRERGGVRRLTRGAGVRQADPAPDGRTAIATRCTGGTCDVVRVELASGHVAPVLRGTPDVSYDRPRWAPDGRRFAVAEQRGGRWRVVEGSVAGGTPRVVAEDAVADVYDASYTADGRALLVVTESMGAPNVARVDLGTGGMVLLTRTTSAAVAPAPIPGTGDVMLLSLRSHGLDLRRLAAAGVASAEAVRLSAPSATGVDTAGAPPTVATGAGAGLAAAAVQRREPVAADTFRAGAVRGPRPYRIGPQHVLLLPSTSTTGDRWSALGVLAGSDPAGRLGWTLQGATGDSTTWRGGALSVAWRGVRPTLEAQLFGAGQRPRADRVAAGAPPTEADALARALAASYRGGMAALTYDRAATAAGLRVRAGGSTGTLDALTAAPATRALGFADAHVAVRRGRGPHTATLALDGHVARGRLGDSSFTAATGGAALTVRAFSGSGVRAEVQRAVADRDAPAFERASIGGPLSPLVDASLLGQRIASPVFATGALAGRRVETARLSLLGGAFTPYAWAGRAPDVSRHWARLVGVEAVAETGPIPFARAPGLRVTTGVAYSYDDPLRRRTRGYATILVRP